MKAGLLASPLSQSDWTWPSEALNDKGSPRVPSPSIVSSVETDVIPTGAGGGAGGAGVAPRASIQEVPS